ncbi:MAG: HAD-IC family P-type ATPase, partial [Cytophagales bacterium]|nr:HAD-IC family P-type ATPase [Cytophagales bacterium]
SEKKRLEKFFPAGSKLRFSQSPQSKLEFVESLQQQEARVMMLGDGLNDAGALKQSHVGIAVTEDIGAFTPACDAILDAKELMKLDSFLGLARKTKKVIVMSFTISFLYNLIGLAFAVSGNLTPVFAAILMPISSISVVAFSTAAVQIAGKTECLD